MKFGFMLPSRGPLAGPKSLSVIAQRGEEFGYSFIMFPDHIVMPRNVSSQYPYSQSGVFPGTDNSETMEQLTTLAFLAGQTNSIRLVTSVMVVPHRSPVVTAKVLSTLDVLSQGRVTVGVGTGWLEEEFQTLETQPFAERGAVTDEYIQVFKELWTSDNPQFDGKFCRFSNIDFLPKPVQKPHPPIWVGGEGRRAIRRAARFGDGWQPLGNNNRFPTATADELAEGLRRLDTELERAGRPAGSLEVTSRMLGYDLKKNGGASSSGQIAFAGSADQIASEVHRFQDLGVDNLVPSFHGVAGLAESLDAMLADMEDFANEVMPKI
ncbi:MAG: LLM class F420-dependent oxidoreductase [SAR202 cluster bacterium]|jgi:probable F420-dependent oxidoreductase|nr:LLM class F420-dependent oxidoreductase [Dehalococcoidia bacterium]MQF88130.1 LLM class F420-dependent oxidoreductase [SAR202 cluster bacterium]|tara:strand:- start:545 stop:1513 length:969 start_codon:yes stop_codon:yes gene_type:complete